MKRVQHVLNYQNKIVEYLKNCPGEYIKIDDIRIDLLAPKSRHETNFDRAWKELIISGLVESCGNAIRINQ